MKEHDLIEDKLDKSMIGEYLICVNNKANNIGFIYRNITVGKKYKIIDIDKGTGEYQIINDIGDHSFFSIKNFNTKQELREKKLQELGI